MHRGFFSSFLFYEQHIAMREDQKSYAFSGGNFSSITLSKRLFEIVEKTLNHKTTFSFSKKVDDFEKSEVHRV